MTVIEMSGIPRSRVRRIMWLCTVLYWVTLLAFSGASFAGAECCEPQTAAQSSSAQSSSAQSPAAALPDAPVAQPGNRDAVAVRNAPLHLLQDQVAIWTSPARIRRKDLIWMAPLAAGIGAGIATDHHVLSSLVSHDEDFNNSNIDASNAMIDGLIAAPVVLYGFGHLRGNEHARETGILAGEALVDSLVVEQGMKLVFWRERPTADNFHGRFFQGSAGPDSSFPSSHSMLAWSAAAAMAEEYRSPWVQAGLYSLATGVSLTRVLGQEHFPTDVLVGSATGWLIGHYVIRKRHRHDALRH